VTTTVHRLRVLSLALAFSLGIGSAIVPAAHAAQVEVVLQTTGLEDLGPGWAYEGWLIEDGRAKSSGVFTVDAQGTRSRTAFTATVDDPSKVSAFVLTIEPSPDPDRAASAVHLLAGNFVQGEATLSTGHMAALGSDFASARGNFVLAAPTGGPGTPHRWGIWWVDPGAGPGPSLQLPSLPAGWVYEGWVASPDGPISTGRFTMPGGADSDRGGPMAGGGESPPFPGQDFVRPPMDVNDNHMAVITIEPAPDNSPAPFGLKPLVDTSIEDNGMGVLQAMTNAAGAFPTGTARLSGAGGMLSPDGQTLADQPAAMQALFRAVWGDRAEARWLEEHTAMLSGR
jgi:hypothetical protein